ncbi:MAG: rhomboid family intramembrane serine protease [Candidatus Eisenbacteria bacterium]
MSQTVYHRYTRSVVPSTTRVVRWLLIFNVAIFVLQHVFLNRYLNVLGLVPSAFLGRGFIWQIVTYMFFHGSVLHILFNMLFLWMMGSEIERLWGGREFLKYYLITGGGAGLVNVLVQPRSSIPTIGASGAIFGLIIAFAMAFPDREILLYFLIRIKAKYFAVLVGVLELVALFLMPSAPIARFAHLGGLLVGFVYLRRTHLGQPVKRKISQWHQEASVLAHKREAEEQAKREAEVDRILDKINKQGISSLSDIERQFLESQSGKRS